MEEAHQQVQDFTGAPRGQAVAALHATGGNVQTAIEMLLEGVVFSEPAVGGEPAAIWEFDDHPNGYRVLAPATQTVLERAHSSGQTQATFIFRQFTYVADLAVSPDVSFWLIQPSRCIVVHGPTSRHEIHLLMPARIRT
jgi:hypothetical protein